jgi:hypothetical protein
MEEKIELSDNEKAMVEALGHNVAEFELEQPQYDGTTESIYESMAVWKRNIERFALIGAVREFIKHGITAEMLSRQ